MTTTVPLHRPDIGPQELEAVARVFESRWLGSGAEVGRFEEQIGAFVGAHSVVATNSGTSALHLALESLDFGPGAEVIVPSLTFAATIQAILNARLVPVFADIDPDSMNISPASIARCRTERTRAIMPVHFRGAPCEMDEILEFAGSNGLVVVEDAAHAFGSTCGGRRVGSFGHVTCFSFDPVKNITCGEDGAIVFAGPGLEPAFQRARRMRMLGIDSDSWSRRLHHGWEYAVTENGFRYHMANVNAAIGLVQLGRFEAFAARRREIARAYDEAFSGARHLETIATDYGAVVPFLYVVRVTAREAFMQHLRERGVSTGVHYIPNHHQERFRHFPRDDLRHTEAAFAGIVSLPLFTEQTDLQVRAVVAAALGAAG